ncbi:MAG: DUF3810 domain-containing protein [Ferruginibacter sp.]|nr:DUF3810 domain-containing protein [Ferruginibacter sp.]
MKRKKSLVFTLVLVVIAILMHIYSNDSTRVENQYYNHIYPIFSSLLRYAFGWLPFSFGDIIYGLVILWLLAPLIPRRGNKEKLIEKIKRKFNRQNLLTWFFKTSRILLIVYIVFNLFWGINYNRKGIAYQLQLKMAKYTTGDLQMINGLLVEKVNNCKDGLVKQNFQYPSKRRLFKKVQNTYAEAEKIYPFLQYRPVSLKPSLWSWLGNYMGFTGYYNPFTGEAQVNTLVPKFLQPFTTCHEVAHQLGYAKEMEANFVGYLAATASKDTLLLYSVYLDLFMYSNRNLFATDSVSAKSFRQKLSPSVMGDLNEWRKFSSEHRSFIEPVFKWVYGKYLQGNQQPQGVLSYDEVTGFLIAYYKQFGKI